jgi:DNA-binding MarR family transcriptional regulator
MPDEPQSLDFLLAQICRLHYARAHALLEDLGLYRGQPPVLHALWDQEGLTHGDLAARLHVSPATMTKMLRRMEKAGFIERRADPDDERVSRVYLTEGGRAIQAAVKQVWHRMEEEILEDLTSDERDMLRRCFLQMRQNLIQLTESPSSRPAVIPE